MSKRIFISKPFEEITSIKQRLTDSEIELVTHSFLRFNQCQVEIKKIPEIIFFGSVRAVLFLHTQVDLSEVKHLACIGQKTATQLTELDLTPSFVGGKSGSPHIVAEEFKTWCNGRNVLFPISNRSLKSISEVFPSDQKEEVIVYETVITGKEIPPCDIYAFTSPSNVEGFLIANTIPDKAEVIAWGMSTKMALENKGYSVNYTLEHSTLDELADYLLKEK